MDFQLNKIYSYLLIAIGCLSLVPCSGQEKPKFNQYQFDIANLSSIPFDHKTGYVLDDSSNNYLLCLSDSSILIIDILKDSVIKNIPRPSIIKYQSNISFPDVHHFSIYQGYDNPSFWVYFDEEFHEYKLEPEKTGFSVFRPTRAQYFPQRKEIYFNILPDDCREYTSDKRYSWPAFAKLNLSTGKTEEINIRAPEKYWGYKFKIPVIYTSQSMGKFLIISYSYDEDIIKYNLETQEQERINIHYPDNKLTPLDPTVEKGAVSKDSLQKSWIVNDYYLNAYYDDEEKTYYRVYKPSLPIQDEKGNYFSNDNKPAYLIKRSLDQISFYKLPMGIFTNRSRWFYSPIYKTINYPILNEIFKNSASYIFTVYGITMYNF